MKKRLISVLLLIPVLFLAGCGILTDTQNYNFNKDGVPIKDSDGNEVEIEVINNKNKTAEIYLDTTAGMKEIVEDTVVQGIVQDSVDAIVQAWNRDVTPSLYTIGDSTMDIQQSISAINDLSTISYSGTSTDALVRAVQNKPNKVNEKIIDPRVKLIITDLRNQLQDYQNLASILDQELMAANKSFAILSVKTQKPFFIVAIGALNDLSTYLDKFYTMPNVIAFNPNMDWNSIDQERNINCKIFAQNSGIEGIDYSRITIPERGNYEVDENGNVMTGMMPPDGMAPPEGAGPIGQAGSPNGVPGQPNGPMGQQPPAGGMGMSNGDAPPQLPGGMRMKQDETASFSILRTDYEPKYLKTNIEGAANFCPEDYPNTDIALDRTVEIELPNSVDPEDLSLDDIRYIGLKSLLWAGSDYIPDDKVIISGKAKVVIPFNSINQIQLSDLEFSSTTSYYDANKGDDEFYESGKDVKSNIEVAFANNGGPTQSLWRVDNQDKTLMTNVYVTDLLALSYATKLEITVTATDPGKIPVWVQSWSQNEDFKNLQSLISLLNQYNKNDNKYEETITIYLMAGDSAIDKEITSEPFLIENRKKAAVAQENDKKNDKADNEKKNDDNK